MAVSFGDKEENSRFAALGIWEQSVGDGQVERPHESESASPLANDLKMQRAVTAKRLAARQCEVLHSIFEIQADATGTWLSHALCPKILKPVILLIATIPAIMEPTTANEAAKGNSGTTAMAWDSFESIRLISESI